MYKHWIWRNLLQVAVGILIVVAVSWLINFNADHQKEKNVRPGWVMERTPGNLQTVTIFNNEVWAGGINGLFRFDRSTVQQLSLPSGTDDFDAVYDLLVDRAGTLWVAHQQGLSLYNGMRWERFNGLPEGQNTPVTAMLQDSEGALWLGLPDGVLRTSVTQQFYQLDMGPVDVLYQDQGGRIWAGSSDYRRGGLFCLTDDEWISYTPANGLIHPSVTSVTQTQDGTIWIGTGFANAGGANYLTASGKLESLTKQDGLAGEKVRQIFQDRQGNIWFCSEYDGVAIFKDNHRIALLTTADGLAGQEVKKIIQDAAGAYWLATSEGLNKINATF